MTNNQLITRSDSVKFLLEEFQLIWNLRDSAMRHSESRVNVFFALVTVIGGAAVWIFRDQLCADDSFIALSILNFFLLLIGILSYIRLIESHVSIVIYTRGLNRIRGFFKKNSTKSFMDRVLILSPYDDQPEFGGFGFSSFKVYFLGLAGLMVVLNFSLVGTFLYLILHLINVCSFLVTLILIASMIILSGFLQIAYAKHRSKSAEKEFKPKYKSPKKKKKQTGN